jgi:hypothetical protein
MKKTKLYLDEDEWQIVIYALNEVRTKLISEGGDTDVVNELLLKIIRSPAKKVKVR